MVILFTVLNLFCGVISFVRPMIGIILLLILECTFIIPSDYAMINFGGIGIAASKLIIVALFLRTMTSNKIHLITDLDARILFPFMSWISFSAFVAVMLGSSTKQDFLSVIFQTAIYYVLPLTVMILSPSEKIKLANICVLIGVFVAIIHLYILRTKNADFISNYYFIPDDIINPLAKIKENLSTGKGTFFIPRASALIMITTAYLSARLILKDYKNKLSIIILILSISVCLLSSITFAQRSFVIVLPLIIMLYMGISFKKRGLIATTIAMFILFGTGYAVINTAASKTNYTHLMEKRIESAVKVGSLDPARARLTANLNALNYVVESPVWGVGSTLTGGMGFKRSTNQDAHGFIRIGLMGGIPAILLIVAWLITLFIRFCKISLKNIDPGRVMCLSAFGAVMCGTFMMMLNTVPILTYSMNVIPYAIFIGLFISEYKKTSMDNELLSDKN